MKDALERIIADTALDPKLRRVLSESLGALAERQMALEKELRATVTEERASCEQCSTYDAHVKTMLVDAKRMAQLSAWGFFDASPFPISATTVDNISSKIFFLNVSYSDFSTILQTKYKAEDGIEYELIPFYGYVENEDKLELLWRLYGFETPHPFSPWARRAVTVRFCQSFRDEPDLNLAENNLESILLMDKALAWNVEILKDQQAAQSAIVSRGGGEAYRYRYTARNGDLALWPLPLDIAAGALSPESVDVILTDENVILTSHQKFSSPACEKIEFHSADEPKDLLLFENRCERWDYKTPTTRGEFNRLLASLSTKDFIASFSGSRDKEVRRYEKGHRCKRNRDQLPMHGEPLDIFFVCKNPTSAFFLEDYANWILAELEQRFPIFSWRGWY